MPFTSETARAAQAKSNTKGVRKDAVSHGLYSMVRSKYGTFEAYFCHLDKIMPGKPADMIAKYIPAEIEQSVKVEHNVLVVNMPEPRQLARDVKVLDVIAVDGCKADSTVIQHISCKEGETDAPECPVVDDQDAEKGDTCKDND